MFRALVLAAGVLAAAPFAQAQVTVIGGGIARDCYEAVKFGLGRAADAEERPPPTPIAACCGCVRAGMIRRWTTTPSPSG
jgi:hypothetical protein